MKKVEQNSIHRYFYRQRLNLSDIKDVYNVFSSIECCEKIDIKVNSYLLDDIDELDEFYDQRIYFLELKRDNPYLSFRFEDKSYWLYLGNVNATGEGLYSRIEKILSNKTKPKIEQDFFNLISAFPGAISGYFGIDYLNALIAREVTLENLVKFVASIPLLYISFLLFKHFSKTSINTRKKSKENFFRRNGGKNSDRLITFFLGTISAVIAMILFNVFFGNNVS